MRSFVCSALLIAAVLIGQQLVTRGSEASGFATSPAQASAVALDKWMGNAR